MKGKLLKITTGAAVALSTFYWGTLPAFAAVNLCPTNLGTGTNLCENSPDAGAIVKSALNVLLFVAFIAALVFLVVGGIRWILSGGDKEGTAKAKGTVTSALIGLAIVLASWLLINIILQFFGISTGLGGIDIGTLKVKPSQ